MLIHVKFLWNHVDILLAAVLLVIIVKSIVVTIVVKVFGYSIRTAFVVSIFRWWFSISFSPILKCILTLSFLFGQGWAVLSSDRRVCFCAFEPCLPSPSCWGKLTYLFHVFLLNICSYFRTTTPDCHTFMVTIS